MSELRSGVNREVGRAGIPYPILPQSLIKHTVSVDESVMGEVSSTVFSAQGARSEEGGGAGLSKLDGLSCCRVVPQQLLYQTLSL